MQIPIDDGIKAGSDTNLSIICRVVAMTGNALNMRKNNKIRFAIVFVCCIRCKDSERWVQRQTEIVFPIWLCRTVFYLRSYKDSERRAQRCKNGCFSLFYRAVFCLVFIEEKISRRKKRYCLHGDSVFHLGEIVWERLPKSNYLFTFVENIKIDIM